MEIRRYIKVLTDHWVIVALAFSLTMALSAVLVSQQPWVYESEGTFIVRPRAVNSEEIVQAFNTLARGVEINSTYALIARSSLVEAQAEEAVGESASGISVGSDVVPGTNTIRITVEGEDPEKTQAFAIAIGNATVDYIDALEDAYQIQALEQPELPKSPSGPNKGLTIVVGGIFGIVLGAALAVVIDYAAGAMGRRSSFEILNPALGTYNAEYFSLRMREEISRVDSGSYSFSVGEIKLRDLENEANLRNVQVLRRITDLISGALRAQDVLCTTEASTLAIIFPNVSGADCRRVLDDWKKSIEVMDLDKPLRVDVDVREYTHNDSPRLEEVPSDVAGA